MIVPIEKVQGLFIRKRTQKHKPVLDAAVVAYYALAYSLSEQNDTLMSDPKSPHLTTQMVHAGTTRSGFGETSEALFLTQGFVYESSAQAEARFKGEDEGFLYSRFSNPTTAMFEERMCALEGAEMARSTASGMAAVTSTMLSYLSAGDHVVSAKALFSSCRYVVEELLPRFGVESTLVDGTNLQAWKQAIRPNTKVLFLESPTNPTLEVIDIQALADLAHENGTLLVVDNVFATALHQKPLQLGADIVVYSATKHIDGQGRCLGGIVLSSEDWIMGHLHNFLRQTGPCISPFNAWVLLKSLETFPLRVTRQCETAAKIADYLADHPLTTSVLYPGRSDHPQYDIARKQMASGGTMVAFRIKGGKTEAFRFSDALRLIRISNNLGDAKSLIAHPATTTHQRVPEPARLEMGVGPDLLRLSVGLEDPDDLMADLDQAFKALA
jgi:O-succinylhomoserine sulfhydrylase